MFKIEKGLRLYIVCQANLRRKRKKELMKMIFNVIKMIFQGW